MARELKTRVAVLGQAQPIADAFARLGVDVGSIRADKVLDVVPASLPGMRYLCVALVDHAEVPRFAQRLRDDLAQHLPPAEVREAIDLTQHVVLMPLPLDAVLVVFVDILAVEAPL